MSRPQLFNPFQTYVRSQASWLRDEDIQRKSADAILPSRNSRQDGREKVQFVLYYKPNGLGQADQQSLSFPQNDHIIFLFPKACLYCREEVLIFFCIFHTALWLSLAEGRKKLSVILQLGCMFGGRY